MIAIKILISGPLQSGKSSYVKYLDRNAINIEAMGYTVGMDLGSIKLNGFDVFLFGTPGLLRFSVMRDVISTGSDGVVYIFDAVSPEKDKDAITILNSIRKLIDPATPIVFLANKQDSEGVRPPEVIRRQNDLPSDSKIFSTSTKTGVGVMDSLIYLVNNVYENYKELIEVLRNYETDIKGLAEELNKDRVQMRDLLNNLEIKRFIELDRIKKIFKVKNGLKNLI